MEVRIETFKPVRVAYMRHHGPYQTCHETWMKFNKWMLENPNVMRTGDLVIGISYDDPETTPPEKIRYDCCMQVNDDFRGDEHAKVQELAGGEFAVYTLKGSYSGIAGAFQRMFAEWFPASGREYRMDPCWEIYRNNPDKAPEEELLTDICVPLKPF
jgi:AraC family transcriptional regulator